MTDPLSIPDRAARLLEIRQNLNRFGYHEARADEDITWLLAELTAAEAQAERLKEQALVISNLLAGVPVGPCTLPQGVIELIQAKEAAEAGRDRYKALASVGTWHKECRPNRNMAAEIIQKQQAENDKLADTITVLSAQLTAAREALRQCYEWFHHADPDMARGIVDMEMKCEAALGASAGQTAEPKP